MGRDAKKQNTRTLQLLKGVREIKERYRRKCAVNKQSLGSIPAERLLRCHLNPMVEKLFLVITADAADRGETATETWTRSKLKSPAYLIIADWWNESVEDIESYHNYPHGTIMR